MENLSLKQNRTIQTGIRKALYLLLFLVATTGVFAQGHTVSGTILDAKTGETLPGVSIEMKGNPAVGAVTDVNGAYVLNVPDGAKSVLVFTYIGYKAVERPVNNQKIINVSMEEDVKALDEVVVLGYGTQKKGSVIGSVERLDAEKLKLPSRTISTSLAGNLAGVVAIQSSGEPGYDSARFWIRGISTYTGKSDPLILVDGVERSMDDVEPEDIADFTILKDATATAVYGVRGGNGVVLITTKKGTVSKPSINLRMENAFSSPVHLVKFEDGATYMKMHNEALKNQGVQPIYSDSKIQNTIDQTDPYYYPDTNWQDALLKDFNLYQKVTLNISGGNETMRYYVSAAFLNQDGMFKHFGGTSFNNNINYKRYNFRTNFDVNASKSTLLSVSVHAIQENGNYPNTDTGTIFSWMNDICPVDYPLTYPDETKVPGISYGQGRNPYQLLARSGYRELNTATAQSVFTVTQDLDMLTKGLRAKAIFSFDNYKTLRGNYEMRPRPYLIKPYGYDPVTGDPILKDENGNYNYVDSEPNNADYYDYLKKSTSNEESDQSTYFEFSLNYNRSFGKHNIGGLFLYNQGEKQYPKNTDVYNSISHRTQGYTGRATYSYADRYFAEFNFGYNGSENFAKDHRYGFFPAYAIGWTPSEEDFMDWMKPAVSYLKLRASYGQVGNDNLADINSLSSSNDGKISRFVYLSRVAATSSNVGFGVSNGYGYGHGAGLAITYYGNPDAIWETATKLDLGFEANFLNGFRLQADYFYESRKDIWVQLNKVPDIFGYSKAQPGGNVGEMENRGVDGTLEYNRQINKDWSIVLKAPFTFAKNKILANGDETPKYAYQSKIGQPYGRWMGYVAEGYFIDQADIDNHPNQTALGGVPKPGDLKYKDVNGDGVVDSFDQIYQGHPDIPEFTYGFSASVAYKNLDFSFMFQGAENVTFTTSPKLFNQQGRGNVYDFYPGDYWTEDNQNPDARFPRLATGSQTANFVRSSWWMVDGSYLKLRSVELGYSLPKTLMSKIGIRSARIYTNGTNLLTISDFKWWDPESRSSNGMYYPIQKSINVGLEVKF